MNKNEDKIMKKLFHRKKVPQAELNQTEAQILEEGENAMEQVVKKANELSEAIRNTPYALTVTVTRSEVFLTERRRSGDAYSLQEDRKD